MLDAKILIPICVLALCARGWAHTWTDKDGRLMEAEVVSADETQVIVSKAGKEFKLPLTLLSDKDQEFVKQWIADEKKKEDAKNEPAPGAAPGELTFDGKPLQIGGKTNLFQYDYSPEEVEHVKKDKGKDTGYKFGLALPQGFDPSKPQKVFIVCTAENNAQQIAEGNIGMMNFFAKQCVASGWVCLGYDTNLGRTNHFADLRSTLAKINAQWPKFKTWSFATGGFSGGAKACIYPMAYLLKSDYKVLGGFLAGCNEDRTGDAQDIFKVPKAAFKNVKIFLGNPTYKAEYAPPVAASMKKNGINNVRSEVHQGKNSLEYGQFTEGLKWLAE